MPRSPLRPSGLGRAPFRGTAVIAAGQLTKDNLRSAAWVHLFRDVYADARATRDHLLRVRGAALLMPPGAVIAGRSAAHLYGATLAGPDAPVDVASPRPWRGGRGIRVVERRLRPADLRIFSGIPVTTPLATAYELARGPVLEDAVVWLDALGRARALRRAELVAYAACQPRHPGWRTAARAVELCDPRAESPPESRVRVYLVLAGLPAPVPQYSVLDNGEFVARVDLAWPAYRVALEYDGQWHADPGQLTRDRRRIRVLNSLGWYVYPVTAADLHDPTALVTQIRHLLENRLLENRLLEKA